MLSLLTFRVASPSHTAENEQNIKWNIKNAQLLGRPSTQTHIELEANFRKTLVSKVKEAMFLFLTQGDIHLQATPEFMFPLYQDFEWYIWATHIKSKRIGLCYCSNSLTALHFNIQRAALTVWVCEYSA